MSEKPTVLTGMALQRDDDWAAFSERSFDSVSTFPTATATVSGRAFLMQQVSTVTDTSDE